MAGFILFSAGCSGSNQTGSIENVDAASNDEMKKLFEDTTPLSVELI